MAIYRIGSSIRKKESVIPGEGIAITDQGTLVIFNDKARANPCLIVAPGTWTFVEVLNSESEADNTKQALPEESPVVDDNLSVS